MSAEFYNLYGMLNHLYKIENFNVSTIISMYAF